MSTPDPDKTARVESDARFTPRPRGPVSQFAPGTIVAGRYRIASILGSGGMGEVYRADDTKLDQPVALKFLPARLARDPLLLSRLHDEVRLGRLIAHPNVCRIYDIVDWEGAHFVAMEFVDGEDLSRLLKRIGRIAHDKAVDIARGIAAGLMAAHAKGILHRDLKPANIMIDSRGEARIMDFGLALAAGEDDGMLSGTPAYMAPELLDRQPATVQSELYALGLVMYELFTGKRAHSAHTLPERIREITSEIATPSSVIRDIDPAVERVILRCLHHDPAQRPRSAREVIDALPGGDPLAAAMAAGETPSPRIIAAAGTAGTLKPVVAWTLLGTIVAVLIGLLGLARHEHFLEMIGMSEPPEVQAARATEMLEKLGIPKQPFSSEGFEEHIGYYAWIFANDTSRQRWQRLARGLPVLTFWLRQESEPLINTKPGDAPQALLNEPPIHLPGAVRVEVDPRGRLYSLTAIPASDWKPRTLNWKALLDAAGLGNAALTPIAPRNPPPAFADARMAWKGAHPEDGTPIRVEAAAYRGVPVHFRIHAPWHETGAAQRMPFGGGFAIVLTAILILVLIAGSLLAWRNLKQRRGDRLGAIRVGAVVFFLALATALLTADHEIAIGHEIGIVIASISRALFWGTALSLVYLALEPFVRRRWPDRLIAWARLISSNWRDSMIGRDILIGIAGGLVHSTIVVTSQYLGQAVTGRGALPFSGDLTLLDSIASVLAQIASAIQGGILFGLGMMVLLMLLTMVLRRRAFAVAALFVVTMLAYAAASAEWWMFPLFAINACVLVFLVARFGLLTIAAAQMTFIAVVGVPRPDAANWYTARGLLGVLFILALALWAFRTSLGEQRALGITALDE